MSERMEFGPGNASDVEAGRCCPHCRHLLAGHNRSVWEAGYAIGQRHLRESLAQELRPAPDGRRSRATVIDEGGGPRWQVVGHSAWGPIEWSRHFTLAGARCSRWVARWAGALSEYEVRRLP